MARKAHIPSKVRAAVMRTHDGCVCCGARDAGDCGHIVSEKNGGEATVENLVRMCRDCNVALGATNLRIEGVANIPLDVTYGEALAMVEENRKRFAKWASVARGGMRVKPFRP